MTSKRFPWLGLLVMYAVCAAVLVPVFWLLDWPLWQAFVGVALGLMLGELMKGAGKAWGWLAAVYQGGRRR